VTAAPRPELGPDQQPHRLAQSPLPPADDAAGDQSWEIDRLLDIQYSTDGDIIAKVRWSTYGPAHDSLEPISALPKHLVHRLAKRKRFTIPDRILTISPTVLTPRERKLPWQCAAVQLHTDPTGALWTDLHRASPRGHQDETVPAQWATSLLAQSPLGPCPAQFSLCRRAFRALDQRWGPHTVDLFSIPGIAQLPRFQRLAPAGTAYAATPAFSTDWTTDNAWANPPFALIGAVVSHLQSEPSDVTLIAPEWAHQPWWPIALSSCAECVRLDPEYARFIPSLSPLPTPSPSWRMEAFRFSRGRPHPPPVTRPARPPSSPSPEDDGSS